MKQLVFVKKVVVNNKIVAQKSTHKGNKHIKKNLFLSANKNTKTAQKLHFNTS